MQNIPQNYDEWRAGISASKTVKGLMELYKEFSKNLDVVDSHHQGPLLDAFDEKFEELENK